MKTRLPRAIIYALSIVISALILSSTIKMRSSSSQLIRVTGLAKQDFVSDLIVWNANFSRKSMSMQDAYNLLKSDAEKIKEYLLSKGIKESEIIFTSVNINKDFEYSYDNQDRQTRIFTGFSLMQDVQIESEEVNKVEDVSRQVTDLIQSGIELNSQQPRYYYTQLADLKIAMLAAATEDARNRAEQIAGNSKAKLGKLKNARMGVFQITARNSTEDFTWGGVYNTASKKKTASVTVKLEFGIK